MFSGKSGICIELQGVHYPHGHCLALKNCHFCLHVVVDIRGGARKFLTIVEPKTCGAARVNLQPGHSLIDRRLRICVRCNRGEHKGSKSENRHSSLDQNVPKAGCCKLLLRERVLVHLARNVESEFGRRALHNVLCFWMHGNCLSIGRSRWDLSILDELTKCLAVGPSSSRAGTSPYSRHCPRQNFQIKPEPPSVDILEIKLHPLLEWNGVTTANLPQASDAGLHTESAPVPILVE